MSDTMNAPESAEARLLRELLEEFPRHGLLGFKAVLQSRLAGLLASGGGVRKVCAGCLASKPLADFSKDRALCHPCLRAHRRAIYAESTNLQEKAKARGRKRTMSAKAIPAAPRKGFEWAGWELEVISDPSRSAKDLGAQLGRTAVSVGNMRHRLRNDPTTIDRAGLSDSGRL